jgi:hypothetical protein
MTKRASELRVASRRLLAAAAVLGAMWPFDAAAQEGGVASSGMGQGQANINVRSDIRLAIKGTRATISERLDQLTAVVTDQMPELRKCYRDIVAKRPTSVGSLAIRITLDPGEPTRLEFKETGGSDEQLTTCVRRVLEKAPFRKVAQPAAAIATLDFENTRAKGEAEMQERREAQERVDLRERAGGGHEASWATSDGKVSFTVGSDRSADAIGVVMRALRSSFAGFADCRRRSEKGGLSPAGDLEIQLQLQRGGKGSAKVKSSTVAHERAVPCVERVFGRMKFDGAPPGQRVDIRVTFGG